MRESTTGTTARPRPGRGRRRLAGIAAAGALLAASAPAAQAAGVTADHRGTPGGGKVAIGFFTQWGIYSGFFEKNLIADGAAARLTEINYAFSSVSADGQCVSGDSWADYQRPFAATEAVSGVADAPGQALAGNFNQLRELKAAYPGLKIVISVGGWSWSSHFSALAATEAGRQKFVRSCVAQYIDGDIPGLPAGAAKGVFDGIDLDWEYPNEPGDNNPYGPQDTADFTALLQDLRGALDTAGEASHRHYLLTADTSPNQYAAARQLQLKNASRSVDWYNAMTLDFHGGWDSTTDFAANLFPDPNDPQPADARFSVAQSVAYYESQGVPASKIALELPYYAHAWTGVGATGDGLYQSATGPAASDQAGYKTVVTEPGTVHFDPVTASVWKYDPASQTFWTYDDPRTVFAKGLYIDLKGLRGASVWSLDGDDANGSLTAALATALRR
ncbi:glycoside hydrolase family 18 protein [Actinocrinis puniceicyclus]|uniref:chitinase n=1 Tax=Actinocrinis puniceicyclus TaxID=977794 RepID=A0A8J8BC90_9ACTN|nr:glycoside hydrolase family 18 protein [Actinocrinis puniceicyclus]MBS2963893.1 glycoside hydrolase family 18 protein [Actinocrinis puniceicyclus]